MFIDVYCFYIFCFFFFFFFSSRRRHTRLVSDWSSDVCSSDLEGFNVFNRANYLRPPTDYYTLTNVPGGISRLDGPLASFGKPNDATRSRELQAVIRFSF